MADNKKRPLPDRDHASDLLLEWAPRINLALRRLKGKIPSGISEEDLHNAGAEGLMDAFHRYDKSRGSFQSFADTRIIGKMRDFIAAPGEGKVDPYYWKGAKQFQGQKQPIAPNPAKSTEPTEPEEN